MSDHERPGQHDSELPKSIETLEDDSRAREARAFKKAAKKAAKKAPEAFAVSLTHRHAKLVKARRHKAEARKWLWKPRRVGLGSTPDLTKLIRTVQELVEQAWTEGEALHIGVTVKPSGAIKVISPAANGKKTVTEVADLDPEIEARVGTKADLEEALAQARERGVLRLAEVLDGAEMMRADEFARAIGVTRETVNQKRRRHAVLGLEGPRRGVRFPAWQLTDDGGLLPGLPDLFGEIGDLPWAVYRFLIAEHPELGMTGVDAMKQGRAADAVALAGNIGRGAVT